MFELVFALYYNQNMSSNSEYAEAEHMYMIFTTSIDGINT